MKNNTGVVVSWFITCLFFVMVSCNNNQSNKEDAAIAKPVARPKYVKKPASTYQDTLTVNTQAAVFYYPDSLQLTKLWALIDTNVYKGLMHSCLYQVRYAHRTIKKEWPKLIIKESNLYRYLLFIKKGGSRQYVDLDTQGDTYGLFVFDGKNAAVPVDMTNIETQFSFYLK